MGGFTSGYPRWEHYLNGIKRIVRASKEQNEIARFQTLTGDRNLSLLLPGDAVERLLALRCDGITGYQGENTLDRILLFQFRGLLPELFFTKVDRMSMANSLECRSPLVYADIVQFALRLPIALKVRGTQRKYLLKRVFERFLPKEILYRPKKGFSIPFYRWLREEPDLRKLVEYYTLNEGGRFWSEYTAISYNFLSEETRTYLARKHNRWVLPWKAVCLGLWWETFIERNGKQPIENKTLAIV